MSTRDGNKPSQSKGINNSNGSVTRNHHNMAGRSRGVVRSCGFMVCRRSDFFPVRILKHLGGKVAEGVRLVSLKIRPSPKDSSTSGRSKPFVTPVDTHRTEAIEDCIEFINSSSSLPRSNSRSANPH
ncbi:hypothetical protein SLE2022_350780 [Rubroshorea leprosula]